MKRPNSKLAHVTVISFNRSPCGTFLVYGTNEQKLHIYSTASILPIKDAYFKADPVRIIQAFDSPGWHATCASGNFLFFACAGLIKLFAWRTGEEGYLSLTSSSHLCLFSGLVDDTEIATCSEDGFVRFWDLRSKEGSSLNCTHTFQPSTHRKLVRSKLGSWITSMALDESSTENFLCGGGPCLALWNLRATQPVCRLDPNPEQQEVWYPQTSLFTTYTDGGSRIAAGGNLPSVFLWDHGGQLLTAASLDEPADARIGHVLIVDRASPISDVDVCQERADMLTVAGAGPAIRMLSGLGYLQGHLTLD